MVVTLGRVGLFKAVDCELFAAVYAALEHTGGAASCDIDIGV